MKKPFALMLTTALLAVLLASPAQGTYPGGNGPLLTSGGLVATDGSLVWNSSPFFPTYGAFSADGAKIAYATIVGDGEYAVRVRTSVGGDTLATNLGAIAGITKITWSPDSTRLAVGVSEADHSQSIHLVPLNGSATATVLVEGTGGWDPEGPDWRPGTEQVGYTRGYDLFTVDADSGVETQRTFECTYDLSLGGAADCGFDDGVHELRNPSWSPDGSEVLLDVFEDNRFTETDNASYVGLLTLGQSTPSKVIDVPLEPDGASHGYSEPMFSPDGNLMVFDYRTNFNDSTSYIMNLTGGSPTSMGHDHWLTDWQPCPNGVCTSFRSGRRVPSITLTVLRDAYGVNAISRLAPAHPGSAIKLTLARRAPTGAWRTLVTRSPTQNSRGLVVAAFPRPSRGSCRITASFSGDIDHTSAMTRKPFAC